MYEKLIKKFHLIILLLIFISTPSIAVKAESDIQSWKDIGIIKTTENMLLEFAGPPTSVILFSEDYFRIKKGKSPESQIFEYYGYMGNNDNLLLFEKTPLTFANEVMSIRARFVFRLGYVQVYHYEFDMLPDPNISKDKYVNIFNKILGDPIRYDEQKSIITYYYKNKLTLTFWPYSPAPFFIVLRFHPDIE